MEEEARNILGAAVGRDEQPPKRLGTWFAVLFDGFGLTEDIEELHGEPVRPAELGD